MKRFLFIAVYLASACACAMALPTVDYGATTTTLSGYVELTKALGLYMPVGVGLTAIIAIMQLLKYFFPKIDGK